MSTLSLDFGEDCGSSLRVLEDGPDELLHLLRAELFGEDPLPLPPPVLDDPEAGAEDHDQLLELEPLLYEARRTLRTEELRSLHNNLNKRDN